MCIHAASLQVCWFPPKTNDIATLSSYPPLPSTSVHCARCNPIQHHLSDHCHLRKESVRKLSGTEQRQQHFSAFQVFDQLQYCT